MTLISNSYGKGRVRVLRVHRDGDQHEVREATVKVMLEGDFAKAFTSADNSTSVATDTMKNIVNIVSRESLQLDNESFAAAIARKFLDLYRQIERVSVDVLETQWQRLVFDGQPHGHSFTKIGNGNPVARIRATRGSVEIESGTEGFTFMKSTGSGWANYVIDDWTTLGETNDRVTATSMDAIWRYVREPNDFIAANGAILNAMLKVFATTYSASVQDSMHRMGLAALEAVPEISQISMAMPNKHYIPINLSPFKLDNPNAVFVPVDEPHGQIECTVARN